MASQNSHRIYYVSNEQYCYCAPSFPIEENKKSEFNVMTIEDVKRLQIKSTTKIQKVVVLSKTLFGITHASRCGKTGFLRIMQLNIPYVFAYCEPILLSNFIETSAYKEGINYYAQFDAIKDPIMCKTALNHGLCLSDVINCTEEIAEHAIKKFPENLNYISDNLVNENIRAHILSMSFSDSRKFTMKPIFMKNINLNPKLSHPEALHIVKEVLNNHDSEIKIDHSLFDDLYILQDIFINWLSNYKNLPLRCTYSLDSIARTNYANVKNHKYKKHLKEISKQRLNITNACCLVHRDPNSLKHFFQNHSNIFNFIKELDLKIKVHVQANDVYVVDVEDYVASIKDTEKWLYDKYISVFIINPNISDNPNEETSESDQDSGSD